MDKLLNAIEGLRDRSETERFCILVVAVVVSVLVVGAIWSVTLGYQLSRTETLTEQDAQEKTELPSLGELFGKSGAAITSSTKKVLRNFLLGDEKEEQKRPEEKPSTNRAIRLPEE